MLDEQDSTTYKVLINHEKQYSLWPEGVAVPAGWEEVGVSGSRHECSSYVDKVWTDMRPLSLRQRSAAAV